MSIWKSVEGLRDGDPVDAPTLNKPLMELVDRTSYLKDRIDAQRNDAASVRFPVEFPESDPPGVGDVVCLDPSTGKFVKALSSMSVFDAHRARNTVYAVGVVVYKETETSGVAATGGVVDISEMDVPGLLESGERFRSWIAIRSPSTRIIG